MPGLPHTQHYDVGDDFGKDDFELKIKRNLDLRAAHPWVSRWRPRRRNPAGSVRRPSWGERGRKRDCREVVVVVPSSWKFIEQVARTKEELEEEKSAH